MPQGYGAGHPAVRLRPVPELSEPAGGDNDSDTIINPFNMRQNRAPAGYDQTNIITTDFIYQLPKVTGALDKPGLRTVLNGWEVGGIVRVQSGMPFPVGSNGSTMGVDSGGQYPDLIGDAYAGQSQYRWINPAAFQRPLDGQYGNVHRNEFRMPGVRNAAATLIKNFAITESAKAAFRCEVFNLFNHAQIWSLATGFSADNQGGLISSGNENFGVPTNFREARILQLALRFSF